MGRVIGMDLLGKSFVLFYPSIELGGAEILLSRVAESLSGRGAFVVVVDGENGIISKNVSSANVDFVTTRLDSPVRVSADYCISFASHISSLSRFVILNDDCRVVFWSIHPLNAIYLPPVLGGRIFSLGLKYLKLLNGLMFGEEVAVRAAIVNALVEKKAFYCMDGESARLINLYYGFGHEFDFIPVPVFVEPAGRDVRHQKSNESITLVWYGRLCDFKAHSLIFLIAKINGSAHKSRIRLIIIGDGDYRSSVEAFVAKTELEVRFMGVLPNKEAASLIERSADVVFAMGTAALESAALGVPTVLMDASYAEINFPYRFSWLFETKQFSLGMLVDRKTPCRGMLLDELIGEFERNAEVIARACFEYVDKNHRRETVVDMLCGSCERSSMSFSEYTKISFYRKPLVLRVAAWLYSLRSK